MCLSLLPCLWNCIFSNAAGRSEQALTTTWPGEYSLLQEEILLFSSPVPKYRIKHHGSGMDQQKARCASCLTGSTEQMKAVHSSVSLSLLDPRSAFSPPRSRLCLAILQSGTVAAQWPRCGYICCYPSVVLPWWKSLNKWLAAFKGNINNPWHSWGMAHRNHTVQWGNNLKFSSQS